MHQRHEKRYLPALALAAFLSPTYPAVGQQSSQPSTSEPEVASRGQRGPIRQIKYGDWRKFCFKTPGINLICRTTITGTWDTGQTAVRADLIEREGDGKVRLQLFLPVGMYLQAGTRLTVDQGKPYQIPYVWCMTNICIAGSVADPQLIREMERGEKLAIEVVDSNVQSVSTAVPLGRFATVRNGAPAQTYQQDIDE
ncbi:invasion associated locus B family protein [Bradyrhizobium sp. CB1650]|uniref:invasion associated locus B family protein n=1 Tax=Bradyrhizobium sp. CB1650 TaxID=3039153 RepID=UPI0024350A2E|nr:invasion associated locus B family protein [Bradyrhizobium sp. CB1650]WGD56086.1 invasion associated locus B family protein [Bradyrhizobium sp. CB1650]